MLLGRDVECARLERLLAEARAGSSSALVIRGDAGIGKTALCEWAAERADGMTVLKALGAESESELPFSALSDLLRPVLPWLGAIPAPQRAALEGALAIGPPVGGDRFTVCAATLSILAAAEEEAPLLAIVDDAQWLDASSAEALLFAARRLDAEGIVVLFAARERGMDGLGRTGLSELRLEGLEPEAARSLLLEHARSPIADPVAAELVAATRGNPLALIEIPRFLSESQLAGQVPLPEPLPMGPTLEQAFLHRVEELPDEVERALLVAAASDTGDLEQITKAVEAMGLSAAALDRAEIEGLVTLDGGRLEFRHPLVRSAVYHGALPAARRAVHRVLAEASTGEQSAERRAWHLAAATPAPDDDVANALEDAALSARRRGGHAAASSAFERAARLTPGDEERARRLLEAADDARRAGEFEQAVELLAEALEATDDPIVRADVQHLRGVLETWRGSPMSAHELLVAEAPRIEERDPAKAALMLADAAWPCFMAGEIHEGLATARRACEVAERAGDVERILTSVLLGMALILRGEDTSGAEILLRVRPLLEESDALSRAEQLVLGAAHAFTWIEEHAVARRLLARVIDDGRARSSPGTLPYALASLSELDFRTGNWASAYAGGSEALRLATETGQASGVSFSLVCLARIEAAQGREADCRAHANRAFELAAFGVRSIVAYAASALGLLELGLGRSDAAIGHLENMARVIPRHGIGETNVVQWAADLIEAYIRSGRTREAERALAELEERARATERTWAHAVAARCRGLLASDEEFDTEFEEAFRWHERTPTPFDRARTELCYGERLRRARRRIDARERLRSALETFERLDAAPWEERVHSELAAAGEKTRRRETSAAQELTPQELQVALIVAQGATNREAGAALFLSPKTIEAHLGRIYRKLRVRSRTELASRLASEGALEPAAAGVS